MTDQELKALLSENNKDLLQSMQIIIENVVDPKFKLLSEEIDLIHEKLDRLEKKVDGIEDKVLEHEFKLKIIK